MIIRYLDPWGIVFLLPHAQSLSVNSDMCTLVLTYTNAPWYPEL